MYLEMYHESISEYADETDGRNLYFFKGPQLWYSLTYLSQKFKLFSVVQNKTIMLL